MALTGLAPFAGYPDYENRGDSGFDGNVYARLSGDYEGILFTAGGGQTVQMPVSCTLACDRRFLYSTYGPAGTGLFPWGRDTLGMEGFASAPWVLSPTWTVRRLSFDGILPGSYPSVTDPSYQIVASDTNPNGWAVSVMIGDIVGAFQGAAFGSDALGNFTANTTGISAGTYTFSSPSGTLYGQYQFQCQARYLLAQGAGPYRPPVTDDLHATLSFTPYYQVFGVIQTGAGHLTITSDPDFPAPGVLTGSGGVYTYTGTGPVFSASAPRVPHKLLDVQVTLDGMPSEITYLGPRLLSPAITQPPGNGTSADLTAYKAAHPDPAREPGAMVDYGSVLLPADAPNGAAIYRWKMTAPFYAGQSTVFFVPVTYFGPQYIYPSRTGDVNDFGNGFGGLTRTVQPPSPSRSFVTQYELGLVPPFVAQLTINITPWTTTTPASTGPDPQDAGDTAQDTATGRTTQVGSLTTGTAPALVTTLTAQAWEGWQNVAGTLARPLASILDTTGQPVQGKYPSLWKTSEEGRYSLCYQDAMGFVTRAVSLDGLSTLMSFPLILFTTASGAQRTGGRPGHTQDGSTGVYYVAAAFTLLDSAGHPTGNEDILVARVDATDTILRWADGTMQKTVVLNTAAAGRPSLILSRYDPAQPVLLLHGSRKFLGQNGGETWAEITT